MRDIKWMVVTPENFTTVQEYLASERLDVVLFSLSDEGYVALSKNTSDILQLLEQQRDIIAAYEEYYNTVNSTIDETNESLEQDIDALTKANQKKFRLFK